MIAKITKNYFKRLHTPLRDYVEKTGIYTLKDLLLRMLKERKHYWFIDMIVDVVYPDKKKLISFAQVLYGELDWLKYYQKELDSKKEKRSLSKAEEFFVLRNIVRDEAFPKFLAQQMTWSPKGMEEEVQKKLESLFVIAYS